LARNVQRRRLPETGNIMMRIGFIDDIQRGHLWHSREFFYDLLRTAVISATGREPEPSLRRQMWADGKLDSGARPATLESHDAASWIDDYWSLSEHYKQEIRPYLARDVLYFGYEMTPGLRDFLGESGITYIDVRLSPLRFLPDLCVAMRSNDAVINGLLGRHCIPEKDVAREADFLKASKVHLTRYNGGRPAGSDASTYLIGQTTADASILTKRGFAKLEDFTPEVVAFADGAPVFFLPHPYCPEDDNLRVASELRSGGLQVEMVKMNGYDLLCQEQPVRLIGLSSGLLQEAPYFRQSSKNLLPFICPVNFDGSQAAPADSYWQFDFDWFTSEEFIAAVVSPQAEAKLSRSRVSNMKANRLRALHEAWWSYPEHVVRPSAYTRAICQEVASDMRRLNRKLDCLQSFQPMSKVQVALRKWHVPRAYRWLDGAEITLGPDGAVRRNNIPCGSYFFTGEKGFDFILSWHEGYYTDMCKWNRSSGLLEVDNGSERFQCAAWSPAH